MRELIKRQAGQHSINKACECGSTIKLSSLPDFDDLDIKVFKVWSSKHKGLGHGPCSLEHANIIRCYGLRRLRRKK